MIVTCENCSTSYEMEDGLIKEAGSKVRCSKCRHVFIVHPAGAGGQDLVRAVEKDDGQVPQAREEYAPEQTQPAGGASAGKGLETGAGVSFQETDSGHDLGQPEGEGQEPPTGEALPGETVSRPEAYSEQEMELGLDLDAMDFEGEEAEAPKDTRLGFDLGELDVERPPREAGGSDLEAVQGASEDVEGELDLELDLESLEAAPEQPEREQEETGLEFDLGELDVEQAPLEAKGSDLEAVQGASEEVEGELDLELDLGELDVEQAPLEAEGSDLEAAQGPSEEVEGEPDLELDLESLEAAPEQPEQEETGFDLDLGELDFDARETAEKGPGPSDQAGDHSGLGGAAREAESPWSSERLESTGEDLELELDLDSLGGPDAEAQANGGLEEELELDLDLDELAEPGAGPVKAESPEGADLEDELDLNLDLEELTEPTGGTVEPEALVGAAQEQDLDLDLDLDELGLEGGEPRGDVQFGSGAMAIESKLDLEGGIEPEAPDLDLDLDGLDTEAGTDAGAGGGAPLPEQGEPELSFDLEESGDLISDEKKGTLGDQAAEGLETLDMDWSEMDGETPQRGEWQETAEPADTLGGAAVGALAREKAPRGAEPSGVDAEAEEPIPPVHWPSNRAKAKKRLSRPLLVVLILVVLGGVAWLALTFSSQWGIQIPFLGSLSRQETVDVGNLHTMLLGVKERFMENDHLGSVLVVTGKVRNDYKEPRSFTRVLGQLYTKDNASEAVASQTAFCGNLLSDLELRTMDKDAIVKHLGNRAGANGVNTAVKSGALVPFMIVFVDMPEQFDEFTVKVLGSQAE